MMAQMVQFEKKNKIMFFQIFFQSGPYNKYVWHLAERINRLKCIL